MTEHQTSDKASKSSTLQRKAKLRLHPAVIAAIIGAAATIIAAMIGSPYLGKWLQRPQLTPVDAAKVDVRDAQKSETFSPENFVGRLSYHPPPRGTPDRIQLMAFTLSRDIPSPVQPGEHLKLAQVSFDPSTEVIRIGVLIKNVWNDPIFLDLQNHNFRLEDDRARHGKLVAALLPEKKTILHKGQERRLELYFCAKGWHGKGVGSKIIYFHIEDLGTTERATWKWTPYMTAD